MATVFLKRWLRNNQPTAKTSLSLSSPRGTAAARKKSGALGELIRHVKHNEDFAFIVLVMAVFLSAIAVFIVAAACGIHTLPSSASSSSVVERNQRRPVVSPLSLLSQFARSARKGHYQRPRGHRYFDYCQDEEHEDYEPYPWKFMNRPLSQKKEGNFPSVVSNREHHGTVPHKEDYPIPMDDEIYVPNPTVIREEVEEVITFNDRSPFYAELRKSYESFFPPSRQATAGEYYDSNVERSLRAVEDLQTYTDLQTYLPKSDHNSSKSSSKNKLLYYDIHDCPESPPEGYPVEWNLVHDVLSQWPADDPELPASGKLHQGLCVFDLRDEGNLNKAMNYRNAEVPFVVRGDPQVAQTVERWNAPHYLSSLIGEAPQGAETSSSGKFTYWTLSGVDKHKYGDYQHPTEIKEMTFGEWLELANVTDSQLLTPESPHYYFKVVGCAPGKTPSNIGTSFVDQSCSMLPGNAPHVPYLADELPFYDQIKSSLYVKEPLSETSMGRFQTSKALLCRFGMKGVMATNHFDGERNFVTVLSGERRYVLAHPKHCGNMALFPYGHPSARHSAVDWAQPNLQDFPAFEDARGNEVVLQAGDSLFLPSLWFHYIVSMSMNVQCNTRSGMDERNVQILGNSCGW